MCSPFKLQVIKRFARINQCKQTDTQTQQTQKQTDTQTQQTQKQNDL